jgi:hydrogenase maturation protein HypF
MLEQRLNCPLSTSAGRWFDTAAAVLGLGLRQSREGEAAQALEYQAHQYLQQLPDFEFAWQSLDLRPLVATLLATDTEDPAQVARGAAMFHIALVNALAHATIDAAREHAIEDIVLGGGCFVNRLLRERLTQTLLHNGLRVHMPSFALLGDAGLALGQAWIVACTLHAGVSRSKRAPQSLSHRTQRPETC